VLPKKNQVLSLGQAHKIALPEQATSLGKNPQGIASQFVG
jgi:hypothetical protein